MLKRTYNLIPILVIIASLYSCSEVIGPMQDFKNNKYPEIISFTSDPSGATDLDPNTPVTLTVTAMDPEGEPLRFAYDSEDGSFADQTDTADTSTVTFYSASYLTSSQPVRARVKVIDDKKFYVSQELEIGTTKSGPTITSIGEIPAYVQSDSQALYTFSANESGIYQVLVYDSTGAAVSYDSSEAAYFYGAGEHVTVTIDGPAASGGNAKLINPPDKVAVILRDSLLGTAVSQFNLDIDDTAPVSSVNPASGSVALSAFPVAITATDANSGVSAISYTINGADPNFSGSGTVIQGSAATVTVGTSGVGTYTLKYCAMDKVGNVEGVKSATYTIQSDVIPPGEANLIVTAAGNGSIYLSWTEPSDIDYHHLVLTWSPGGTGGITVSKGTMTYVITSLTANTEYTVTAVTVDTSGNTSPGTSVTITPPSSWKAVHYIYTRFDLNAVRSDVAGYEDWYLADYYILMADISLSDYPSWSPIGSNEMNSFTGIFDGNGHTISNLKISSTNGYQGLFGYTFGATVKDVSLTNVTVEGNGNTAALVGYSGPLTSISGCTVTGTITGTDDRTGSIAGYNYGGPISGCNASVTVICSKGNYTGGLIGYNNDGTITNCSVEPNGSATYTVSGIGYTGGLIGTNTGTISNCHASGDVVASGEAAGGLVGHNLNGTIEYCYATGDVSGTIYVGGLVGASEYASASPVIRISYATGSEITGVQSVGGLVGYNNNGILINCYYANVAGIISGSTAVGGIVGYLGSGSVTFCYTVFDNDTVTDALIGSSTGGTAGLLFFDTTISGIQSSNFGNARSTTQMQTQATFTNWDFVNDANGNNDYWSIGSLNGKYPYLTAIPPSN